MKDRAALNNQFSIQVSVLKVKKNYFSTEEPHAVFFFAEIQIRAITRQNDKGLTSPYISPKIGLEVLCAQMSVLVSPDPCDQRLLRYDFKHPCYVA